MFKEEGSVFNMIFMVILFYEEHHLANTVNKKRMKDVLFGVKVI